MYAWAGRILHVDLGDHKIWSEPLPEDLGMKMLGSRGVNVKILWDLMKDPSVDALAPGNVLILGAGTLNGTGAPSSGRMTVTCRGPVTNLYLKTNAGGHWGSELKFAGFDHVVVQGASQEPVYLWIQDGQAELRDAAHLWGKDVRTTTNEIKDELQDRDLRVAAIGPAGERLVRVACVMNTIYHAAARGGAGAVMGSKKLKAIAVRGHGEVKIKNPERFREISVRVIKALAEDSAGQYLYNYGTMGITDAVNESHSLPSYNFRYGHVEDARPLTGQALVEDGYLKRREGCFSCTVSCHRYSEIDDGLYKGLYTGGPEYESVVALGAGTGVFNTDSVLKANDLCNTLGLDTISTGDIIQWAMECYERGVLTKEDTEGLDLRFGSGEALVKAVEMIGYREGKLGNLLAEGVKRAADKVGKDSYKWAMCNSKGLEQSGIETRSAKGNALAFAVNPRGPDHLHTEVAAEFGSGPEAIALIEKITGDKKWAVSYLTDYRAEIVRWHEDVFASADSLGFCGMTCTEAYGLKPVDMAGLFSAATGMELTEEEMKLAGRRIVTLEKCFNVKLGADRKLDDLPWRLMNEPASSGPRKGSMNSPEELNGMLDRYYALHGWDLETSWPQKETLTMLGFEDVAKELEACGRLP